jgi:hypothetical protein
MKNIDLLSKGYFISEKNIKKLVYFLTNKNVEVYTTDDSEFDFIAAVNIPDCDMMVFNNIKRIPIGLVFHECGHVMNPYMKTDNVKTEVIAHEWAIKKAKELKSTSALKQLLNMINEANELSDPIYKKFHIIMKKKIKSGELNDLQNN